MELHFNSQVREAKQNSAKLKRRNLLHLIHAYLQEEGLFETASALFKEAKLSNDIKVCDNVDLGIVLQEYVNYHYIKFDKYPTICKKIEPEEIASKNVQQCKTRKKEIGCPKSKENETTSLENSFTIMGYKNPSCDAICDNLKRLHEERPFSKFISRVPQDIQQVIEQIYTESKTRSTQIGWDDVVGLDNVKETLKEAIVYPENYPELFRGLVPWKAVLLYGPPGSGKTLLAKALSDECNRMFINISPATIMSKWRGESEKIIKAVFQLGRYYSPSVLFMDEIDSVCSKRGSLLEHEASLRLKNEILTEIDGLDNDSAPIFFLATSNSPWNIDRAMLRRMEKRILVPLPSDFEREVLFKNYFRGKAGSEIDFSQLAEPTRGYSGADISIVCKEATMQSIRGAIKKSTNKNNEKCLINTEIILEAIGKIKPSVEDLQEKYAAWEKSTGAN